MRLEYGVPMVLDPEERRRESKTYTLLRLVDGSTARVEENAKQVRRSIHNQVVIEGKLTPTNHPKDWTEVFINPATVVTFKEYTT